MLSDTHHRQNRVQQRREYQIHGGARQQHGDSMQDRPSGKRAVQLGGGDIAFPLVQQFDVAAQRDGGEAVFGAVRIPADPGEQRFAETDAEAQYLEAKLLGNPVVAKFMDRHQDADRHQKGGDE